MPNRFSKKKWAERPSSYRWSHLSRTSNPYAQRLRDYSDFWRKRQASAAGTARDIPLKANSCETVCAPPTIHIASITQNAMRRQNRIDPVLPALSRLAQRAAQRPRERPPRCGR
ncbi:hypothetical protein KTF24_03695, partial [Burkholderia multivorans]|nr:hypothetical protein [Burkholderia multivorans]